MDTTRLFKDSTKTAAAYLAEQGIEISHTRLLEALSRAFGERNWSTLRAQLSKLQGDGASAEVLAAGNTEATRDWDAASGVPMTDAQFASHGGNRCPFCGSSALEASGLEADGPLAWDHTECDDCGSTWSSSYSVCGYFNGVSSSEVPASNESSPGLREDVVEELVEDVRQRARDYGFSHSGYATALRLVQESADVLNSDASEAEMQEAATRLA